MNDRPPFDTHRILASRVSVPDHVVHRSFEAETLLLNLETGRYHGLNPTGGRMLELLKENGGRVRESIEQLAGEYGMEPDEISGDLTSFCAELAERGLIEVHDRQDER